LSLRDIEELLFKRGVTVTYETIRCWCDKFGKGFAHRVKAARRNPGSTWHLDEMFVTLRKAIAGSTRLGLLLLSLGSFASGRHGVSATAMGSSEHRGNSVGFPGDSRGLTARVGGAKVGPGVLRVAFWSALSMGLASAVGAIFGAS
jgi:hypothetical protein